MKIRANILRDRRTNRVLTRDGWQVIRLWETDILNDPAGCAAALEAVLHRCRAAAKV
jgi:G:T-mismatch repair DNA endonuclease (very short patch repair protein)